MCTYTKIYRYKELLSWEHPVHSPATAGWAAVLCEPRVLDMATTNLEHSPHTTWSVCSPTRKLCCPSVTRPCGCQCLGQHIWAPLGCFFMALCRISSITNCWKNLLELMKITLLVIHYCVSLEMLLFCFFSYSFWTQAVWMWRGWLLSTSRHWPSSSVNGTVPWHAPCSMISSNASQ